MTGPDGGGFGGIGKQFFSFALYLLAGALVIELALELLARLWPWIALLAAAVLAARASFGWWRNKRQPW